MLTLNKGEIIHEIRKKVDLPYEDVEKILTTLQEVIYEQVESGNSVKLSKLCTFIPVEIKPRSYVEIGTNTQKVSSGKKSVKVKISPKLKATIENCQSTQSGI